MASLEYLRWNRCWTTISWNLKCTLGWPRGLSVKCARSATCGPGLDPGRTPKHCFSGHAEATSHIQQLEGCTTMTYNYLLGLWRKIKGGGLAVDVSSELVFHNKMRGISMDVSSGLIVFTKKIKIKCILSSKQIPPPCLAAYLDITMCWNRFSISLVLFFFLKIIFIYFSPQSPRR